MPRASFRQFARLHPVESLKHVVDANGAIVGATPATVDVINTVDSPVASNSNQCKKMSTVSAIYLRVEVIGKTSATGIDNVYMLVFKNPGNLLTAPSVDNVGTSDRRKYVIHQEMLMLTPQNVGENRSFPRTLFNGVIKVPRGYKRNGVEDRLQVIIGHRTGEVPQLTEWCIQCIYKEFQ